MFSKSSNLLTQADIKSLEEIVGYSLPTDFINQYLHFNGGVADKTHFYVEDDDGYVEVSFFIPIKYPSTDLGNIDIATSYSHLVSKGIPNKYLPFAVDWGGKSFFNRFGNKQNRFVIDGFGRFYRGIYQILNKRVPKLYEGVRGRR